MKLQMYLKLACNWSSPNQFSKYMFVCLFFFSLSMIHYTRMYGTKWKKRSVTIISFLFFLPALCLSYVAKHLSLHFLMSREREVKQNIRQKNSWCSIFKTPQYKDIPAVPSWWINQRDTIVLEEKGGKVKENNFILEWILQTN